jgi:hypothetical protein
MIDGPPMLDRSIVVRFAPIAGAIALACVACAGRAERKAAMQLLGDRCGCHHWQIRAEPRDREGRRFHVEGCGFVADVECEPGDSEPLCRLLPAARRDERSEDPGCGKK